MDDYLQTATTGEVKQQVNDAKLKITDEQLKKELGKATLLETRKAKEIEEHTETRKKNKDAPVIGMNTEHAELLGFRTGFKVFDDSKKRQQRERRTEEKQGEKPEQKEGETAATEEKKEEKSPEATGEKEESPTGQKGGYKGGYKGGNKGGYKGEGGYKGGYKGEGGYKGGDKGGYKGGYQGKKEKVTFCFFDWD